MERSKQIGRRPVDATEEPIMKFKFYRPTQLAITLALTVTSVAFAQDPSPNQQSQPVFTDGLAQVVEAFKQDWVQHDLFVQTEFDSDQDGKLDRVHVSVTRPKPTETQGLKVPVVYQSSPYYSGTG